MNVDLFSAALVYFAAAALAAPLGKKLGVGAVLGYLAIGALIGPSALGLVGSDGEEVMHFAEFGVVLMLFLIGLELDLSKLWRMRGPIFGLGGLQVLLTSLAISLASVALGLSWREGLALGLILALSSTAIVMQTLKESGLSHTASGQQSFAVLLFQDIAVIPIIALLPLLATHALPQASSGGDSHGGGHGEAHTPWIETLPAWAQGFAILAALALIIIIGKFVLTPWLRWVARLKVPEALTSTSLALVVGVALLMSAVGLSPALGTFVAGVMLASNEFRHELESDIEPFKALLLAVFFLSVGAGINFALIASDPLGIGLIVLGLIAIKAAVLYLLGKFFGLSFDQRTLFAAALAQGGEFAFVLGSFAVGRGVLEPDLIARIIAAVALSMALAPILLLVVQRGFLPRFGTLEKEPGETREPDVANNGQGVILAGFGRFGHPLARLLRSHGCMPTVLEADSDHVDFVRRLGLDVYYGDATRLELLRAAGAEEAKVLILAIDDEDDCMKIIESCQKHFPELQILARACSRDHAFRLHESGVEYFIEQLGSSLECGISALGKLGKDPALIQTSAEAFRKLEMAAIARDASSRHDLASYRESVRQNLSDLDSLLSNAPEKPAD
ncbi:MAG: monovalent cation:proton antiporter-2 (CPA2) family protein [Verrucomicrobiales bacterium]